MPKTDMALPVAERALEIIKDRRNWTRGAFGRDKNSRSVAAEDKAAVRFCAIGVAKRACVDLNVSPFERTPVTEHIIRLLTECINEGTPKLALLVNANDMPIKDGGLGHKGIVKAYECAVGKLRGAKR